MSNRNRGYGIPAAIIFAGAIVALAVLFTGNSGSINDMAHDNNSNTNDINFREPSGDDHIRGNPDAPISIIEYSDFECPFCARLHPTLSRIIEDNNDVNWVYRHFPLSSHSRALSAAVASECIANLGTNNDFWEFADNAFNNAISLSDSWYKEQAVLAGLDENLFSKCLEDSSIISYVQDDLSEVKALGGRGTPFVVIRRPDGQLTSFSGALSYEQISSIIEQARHE